MTTQAQQAEIERLKEIARQNKRLMQEVDAVTRKK